MNVIATDLAEVKILEPAVYGDERGFFTEFFRSQRNADNGLVDTFVQDNHSRSRYGVVRGLHFQHPRGQVKVVKAVTGKIFDVAVDVRAGSPTFGRWVGVELSEDNHRLLYIPEGFAHGFCTLTDRVDVIYKCSDYYSPKDELGILWNDPAIGISWPISDPKVSPKDGAYPRLQDLPLEKLPAY